MRIGLVHFRGGMGENIRNAAIGDFLRRSGFEVVDVALENEALSRPPLFSHVTLDNLRSFLRAAFRTTTRSLIAEIGSNHMLRLYERSLPRWYRHVLSFSNQVDIFHAETHLAAYVCALVRRKSKRPFVFDMHGARVEEGVFWGEAPAAIRFWQKVEREAVKEADWITVVSRAMVDFISERYGTPGGRFLVIPNGTELYRDTARYAKPLRIIYGGNFAYYERVEDFTRTAKLLEENGYKFVLMGDGVLRNQIFDYINTNYVDLVYLGRKTREESLRRFCQMQIGVAPSTKDITRKVASPMKVLDYASCGLPIVTVNVGEWSDVIRDFDCGIVTEHSAPEHFAQAIEALSSEDVWKRKSENGRRMVQEKFTWDKVLQPLVNTCFR